ETPTFWSSRLFQFWQFWQFGNPTSVCLSQIFKSDVHDGVVLPIFVIEVPPLLWVHREPFCLHRVPQDGATLTFLGCPAWVIRVSTWRHFVIAAGHLHRTSGLQVIQGQIHRAAPVVP